MYYTVDFGYTYVGTIADFLPTITLTIYPRPVNPNLPFTHYEGWEKLKTRLEIIMGTTLVSVEEEDVRNGIIGNKALILGAGYRFLPFAKIIAGLSFFKDGDINESGTEYSTNCALFAGISVDMDVAKLIKGTFTGNY